MNGIVKVYYGLPVSGEDIANVAARAAAKAAEEAAGPAADRAVSEAQPRIEEAVEAAASRAADQAAARVAGEAQAVIAGAAQQAAEAAVADAGAQIDARAQEAASAATALLVERVEALEQTPAPAVLTGLRVIDGVLYADMSDGTSLRATLPAGGAPSQEIAPVFTEAPSLIGSTALGSTITVSLGAASGTPAPALTGTLTRPGKSAAAVLDGATFTVEAADQGGTITLDVTATNAAGSATAGATLAVPAMGPPAVTVPVPGGNVLSTKASITPEGEVTITNTGSALSGDLGVVHYLVKADNMLGKTVTARRSTNDPVASVGNDLLQWQMAWAYDVDGEWLPFDSYVNSGGFIVASNAAPAAQPTVYIARRPVFSFGRWLNAIARWIANPHTSPTPSGDASYIVGNLPANARAPALPLYGIKIGTGPAKVTITGVIHTDEHIAAYAMEALVDWLLSDDPDAAYVRNKCSIFVYPNMNPQSLYAGASRVEVATGDNANRLWTNTGEFDAVPLSKTWRDVWAVDLAGGISGSLDFHDAAREQGYAMTFDAVNGSSEFMGAVEAEYYRRNGFTIDRNPGGTTLPVSGGVNRYLRDTFGGTWAVTVEHYISKDHGIPQWQAWGRDFGRGLRDYYDTDGTAKWIDPAWQVSFTSSNGRITETNGIVRADRDVGTAGVAIPIAEGKTVELIFDFTAKINLSRWSIRQGSSASLSAAGFVELATSGSTTSTYRRTVQATWHPDRPFVGVLGLASNGAAPSGFTMSNLTRYRVLP